MPASIMGLLVDLLTEPIKRKKIQFFTVLYEYANGFQQTDKQTDRQTNRRTVRSLTNVN